MKWYIKDTIRILFVLFYLFLAYSYVLLLGFKDKIVDYIKRTYKILNTYNK